MTLGLSLTTRCLAAGEGVNLQWLYAPTLFNFLSLKLGEIVSAMNDESEQHTVFLAATLRRSGRRAGIDVF
jgi:hypothetical protein